MKLAQLVSELRTKTEADAVNQPSHFTVKLTGSIENARLPSKGFYYARWEVLKGPDWILENGVERGVTQIAASHSNSKLQ